VLIFDLDLAAAVDQDGLAPLAVSELPK